MKSPSKHADLWRHIGVPGSLLCLSTVRRRVAPRTMTNRAPSESAIHPGSSVYEAGRRRSIGLVAAAPITYERPRRWGDAGAPAGAQKAGDNRNQRQRQDQRPGPEQRQRPRPEPRQRQRPRRVRQDPRTPIPQSLRPSLAPTLPAQTRWNHPSPTPCDTSPRHAPALRFVRD